MKSFKNFLNEQDDADLAAEKQRNKRIRLSRRVHQAKNEIEKEGEKVRSEGGTGAQVGAARRSALSDMLSINLPDDPPMSEAAETPENDYEGEMATGELRNIISNAQEIAKMLKDDSKLEAWVQSKITRANDYINAVHDYLKNTPGSVG